MSIGHMFGTAGSAAVDMPVARPDRTALRIIARRLPTADARSLEGSQQQALPAIENPSAGSVKS
jgi:hypothetical protein